MNIDRLKLENIGPFKTAELDFSQNDENHAGRLPVIILTGENGTGKSIIIDAIRTAFIGAYGKIEREINSNGTFEISAVINLTNGERVNLVCKSKNTLNNNFETNNHNFNQLFSTSHSDKSSYQNNYIINYWSSKLSNDDFKISHIEAPNTKNYLANSLSGVHSNVDVTKLITFFDYLQDSKDEHEKEVGTKIYDMIKSIIETSINDGCLKFVSRTKLQPIINIRNKEVTLDKLSSGSLYLIQRLLYLLKQVYSSCINFNIPISKLRDTPGILLIDEAENHLHPKWQKIFLSSILDLFPNLQLIVTTHSPFIVSSVPNSRVYVCTSDVDYSYVKEETDFYANKPIEEILMSPLFNTSNFNRDISNLLLKRKQAQRQEEIEEIEKIEKQLLEINPEYFDYLNIENVLKSLKK